MANPSPEQRKNLLNNIYDYVRPRLISFTGDSAAFLIRLLIGSSILLLSLYFFLCDGPGMVRSLMDLSPLDDRYEMELLAEFDRTARAIVLATILSALIQGLTAGIGYYFAGMPSLVLLIALTSICALIPFFGTGIVWVPVCIYLAVYEERFVAAALLAAWGVLVVGTVDNLVKILVLHGQSQLHPLLALLSVLGGLQALGPIGILVGPMVVTLLQTTLGIIRHELSQMKEVDGPTLQPDGSVALSIKPLSGLIRKVKKSGKEAVPNQESDNPASPTPSKTEGSSLDATHETPNS
jgi:predicted PurR-regulated permease PerM